MGSDRELDFQTVKPRVFQPRLPGYHVRERHSDMSSCQSWTLWQRLPPRYQLTTRTMEFAEDNSEISANVSSASTPRHHSTPRPKSASPLENPLVANDTECGKRKHLQRFSFPPRRSDYVSHFQKQQRVSSARRRLAETPPTPQLPGATSERAQTAPAFPVTSPAYYMGSRPDSRNTRRIDTPTESRNLPVYSRSRYSMDVTRADIGPLENFRTKTYSRSPTLSAPESIPKKYVVQDTTEAVMYIDRGKVIYFRKSRHDLTNLLKTQSIRSSNRCFLADLRRDYLKHPKYESGKSPNNRLSKQAACHRAIAHERVDYNRRVEHILNYYSDDDDGEFDVRSRPQTPNRLRSPRGTRIKGLALTPAPSRPPSRTSSPSPDSLDSPNDYIRLHRRSKLHDRNFYLRTPGMRLSMQNLQDFEKCKCDMCRIEMQLATVTGINDGHELILTQDDNIGQRKATKEKIDDDVKTEQVEFCDENKANPRVTFKKPEMSSQDHTLTITCTLPEVSETPDIGVNESGFENDRAVDDFTQSVESIAV